MKTNKIALNVVKGLALGVIWPAAMAVVVSRRANRWIGTVAHESLDLAISWEDKAEEAGKQSSDWVKDRWTLMTKPPLSVSGGSFFSNDDKPEQAPNKGEKTPPEPAPAKVPMEDKSKQALTLSDMLWLAAGASAVIAIGRESLLLAILFLTAVAIVSSVRIYFSNRLKSGGAQ